jgi:hypothetical protein
MLSKRLEVRFLNLVKQLLRLPQGLPTVPEFDFLHNHQLISTHPTNHTTRSHTFPHNSPNLSLTFVAK